MENKNAQSVSALRHHDTKHFFTRFLITFFILFSLLGVTSTFVLADDDVIIVEETVDTVEEEITSPEVIIEDTHTEPENSDAVPGVEGSGTVADLLPQPTVEEYEQPSVSSDPVPGVTGSNESDTAVPGVSGSNDEDTAVPGVTGNNDPVPGVVGSNDSGDPSIEDDSTIVSDETDPIVIEDPSDDPLPSPGGTADETIDDSNPTDNENPDIATDPSSDADDTKKPDPNEPVPGVVGEGNVGDLIHDGNPSENPGTEQDKDKGNEDPSIDQDDEKKDEDNSSGGTKDNNDGTNPGEPVTDDSTDPDKEDDPGTIETPVDPGDHGNTNDPENPDSGETPINQENQDGQTPSGSSGENGDPASKDPDDPETPTPGADQTDPSNENDTGTGQNDPPQHEGADDPDADQTDPDSSPDIPSDNPSNEEPVVPEEPDTPSVSEPDEPNVPEEPETPEEPVITEPEEPEKPSNEAPLITEIIPEVVIPGVSGSNPVSYYSYTAGNPFVPTGVTTYLSAFHTWYANLSPIEKLLVGMKQIGKKYAVAKEDISVTNTRSTDGIEVGSLPANALCFIISEVDENWVFIESGEVRGFVRKDLLLTGYAAEKIVGEAGEANMPLAITTLNPSANSAFRYVLLTTSVVPKQPTTNTVFTTETALGGLFDSNGVVATSAATVTSESENTSIQVSDLTDTGKRAAAGDTEAQQEIIGALAQATESEWENYGLSRSFLIAQAIEDSEWLSCSADEQVENGLVPEDNNVLAMNADLKNDQWDSPWDGAESERTIVTQSADGTVNYQTESMRTYADLSAAMDDYAAYKTSMHPELVGETNVDQVIHTAMRGYANDTSYQSSIKSLIETYDLTQYDVQKTETNDASFTNLLSNTTTIVGRTDATNYTQEQLELIWAIVAQEDDNSYEGALAVVTSAMNRADIVYGGHGTSVLLQLTAPGQYCYSSSVSDPIYYQRRLNGNVPDYVKQAVADCINKGIRNHTYLNFRSHNTTGGYVKIGANYYF
ncbi:MAG: glucosaminidase domain-containing protein [Eubacteriales bacterium]|nr:glucosaminidase domain-containing protein [Eubacteriales bacterium]